MPDTMSGSRRGRGCCVGGCLLHLLTIGVTLLVATVWLLQRYPGEDWWLTTLLTWGSQLPWVVLPALMLLVTVISGRPLLSAVNLAAALFALLFVAHFQINPGKPDPGDSPVIRVATWNVHGFTRDDEALRERILAWNCDIVCIQESVSSVLDDLLPGYEYVHDGHMGVYVRGEIVSHERVWIGKERPRYMLVVNAFTDAGPVTVMTVHLPRYLRSPFPRDPEQLSRYVVEAVEERGERIAEIVSHVPEAGPVILAGDFNTPPGSRYWRLLNDHLTDVFDATGFGFGYTFLWRWTYPLVRIDYIWVGGGAIPITSRIKEEHPSDHRPVIAEIALPRLQYAGFGAESGG